ncbi:MAG: hypothetical protein ABIO94_11055, partial [Opitutaceae bacterium]
PNSREFIDAGHLTPRLHQSDLRLALSRRPMPAWYGFVMRYRSATVAGSHGLPCFPEEIKNDERATLGSRSMDGKLYSYHHMLIRRYELLPKRNGRIACANAYA